MIKRISILSLLLLVALTLGAQKSSLGLKTDLSEKSKYDTRYWFNGPVLSTKLNFGKTARPSTSTYGTGGAISISPVKISFSGSSRQRSVANGTLATKGKSKSLGLTACLSGSTELDYSASGSNYALKDPLTYGRKGGSKLPSHNFSGSMKQINLASTTNNPSDPTYTQFDAGAFNDAVPSEGSGPIGDAVLPMMILLSLLVAYKKFRK